MLYSFSFSFSLSISIFSSIFVVIVCIGFFSIFSIFESLSRAIDILPSGTICKGSLTSFINLESKIFFTSSGLTCIILFNIAFNNELLPDPTSPMMQTNSPFFTEKLISLKFKAIGLSSSSAFSIPFCSAPQEKVPFSIFIIISSPFVFSSSVIIFSSSMFS